jgi:Tfp pilus assembly protein PilZ
VASSLLPLFTLKLTTDDLWTHYARLLVEGGLSVATDAVPRVGAEVRIQLTAPKFGPPELSGQVMRRELRGFHAAVAASSSFKAFFARHASVKRAGRRVRRPGGKRATERFVAQFDVKFRNFHELPLAEVRNVSLGGIFAKTFCAPPLRSKVKLRLDLPDGDVEIDGQVVHVVGARQAMGQAYSPGVNIAFAKGPSKAHERLAELISTYERLWPRVLLCGGTAGFAQELIAELKAASIELTWAENGSDTRERLIDALFDYDLILFDSGLGGFDVRSFLDRAVDLGTELELRTAILLPSVRPVPVEPFQPQKELILSKDSVSRLGKEIKKLLRSRSG